MFTSLANLTRQFHSPFLLPTFKLILQKFSLLHPSFGTSLFLHSSSVGIWSESIAFVACPEIDHPHDDGWAPEKLHHHAILTLLLGRGQTSSQRWHDQLPSHFLFASSTHSLQVGFSEYEGPHLSFTSQPFEQATQATVHLLPAVTWLSPRQTISITAM